MTTSQNSTKFSDLNPGDRFVPADVRYLMSSTQKGKVWKVRQPFEGMRWNSITVDGNGVADFSADYIVEKVGS